MQAMWQQSKLAKDASMAQIHTWIPWGLQNHVTMALSSSSRSPMTTVERPLRPGTSGTLNRAWPDHPGVAISQRRKTATAWFESSRAAASLKFQAFHALLNSPADRCHGGKCNTLICAQHGHAQSILMWDSFIRDSFTEDALLSAWDQQNCWPHPWQAVKKLAQKSSEPSSTDADQMAWRLCLSDRHN